MPESALRIAHVAAPAPVGGLERVVQSLAAGQRRAGHTVLVIAVIPPEDAHHPFVTRLRQDGVDVAEVRLPGNAYFGERRAVRLLLQRFRPDVVHTHGYRSDLLDGSVARSLRIPRVSTVHGSSRMGGRSHFFEWLQLRAWRGFDAVIAVSEPLRAMLLDAGVAPHRIHVVPNAWSGDEPRLTRAEARAQLGLAPHAFVVGFVGRLIRAKGPDLLLHGLAAVRDVPWRAVLIGDGVERGALETWLAASGLADRVLLAGHLDEATHLYPAFDAFVLSSRTEGTPIALLEAMAARVPIVASRVGGVPDVVTGEEALLVDAQRPVDIAQALARIHADPHEAGARARRARMRLEARFGPAVWLARHEAIYRQVSGGPSGTTR